MSVTTTAPAEPLITGGLTAAAVAATAAVARAGEFAGISLVVGGALLMLTHVVAAAIVIPVIARRLSA
ncbi:hypothetical protein [Nonomuraea jabiensis]|uniref:Uncharacterized protein n=1 Tax=Nonomuraea jabiensis TaxID=882448 RepID=A0A7W9L9U7_9ACTN|nr:hypothetical protein [Nonomuraea jabiensis]MBB5776005.1 hypothetical protein [Nonomuraea jabiensis]